MLGIGKLPDDMRPQVDAEGIMSLAEFVPVTRRSSAARSVHCGRPELQRQSDDVLTMLPTRSLAFDVPPEYVLRAVGVPARRS